MSFSYSYTFPFTLSINVQLSTRPMHAHPSTVLQTLQNPKFLFDLGPLVTSVTQPDPSNQPSLYTVHESDKAFFGLIPYSWSIDVEYEKTAEGCIGMVKAPAGVRVRGVWSVRELERVSDDGVACCEIVDNATITAFGPLAVFTALELRRAHRTMLEKMPGIFEKPHME